MKHARWLALALVAIPSFAHADIAPMPVQPARLSISLISLGAVAEGDAPPADVRAIEDQVRSQLAGARTRIDSCVGNGDMREDPLRSRVRRLHVRLRFSRSGRPVVSVHRSDAMPALAERCIMEAVRSVSVRTAPRGDVTVTAVFQLS